MIEKMGVIKAKAPTRVAARVLAYLVTALARRGARVQIINAMAATLRATLRHALPAEGKSICHHSFPYFDVSFRHFSHLPPSLPQAGSTINAPVKIAGLLRVLRGCITGTTFV